MFRDKKSKVYQMQRAIFCIFVLAIFSCGVSEVLEIPANSSNNNFQQSIISDEIFKNSLVKEKNLVIPERFKSCGKNTSFACKKDDNFSDCVVKYQKIVRSCRVDISRADDAGYLDSDFLVKYNSPFELLPDKDICSNQKLNKGVVIAHGYSDSPYHLKGIAEFFQSQCFTVRVVLLPGHGTRPGDLLEVKYEAWIDAVNFGIDTFLRDSTFDEIYISGFSTGAAIALYLASLAYESDLQNKLKGLVLFSPLLAINKSSEAWMASIIGAIPYVRNLHLWLSKDEDLDFFQYESGNIHSIGEVSKLAKLVRTTLKDNYIYDIPVFMAFSLDDATVSALDSIEYFSKYMVSTKSQAVAYYSTFSQSKFLNTPLITDKRFTLVNVTDYTNKILTLSHIAVPITPTDFYYGINGHYKNCLLYPNDSEQFKLCYTDDNRVWLGEKLKEVTNSLPKEDVLRRVEYNTRYDLMLQTVIDFLNK